MSESNESLLWCDLCEYVPPAALAEAEEVMDVTLSRCGGDGWRVVADGFNGDRVVFQDSVGWSGAQARAACDEWMILVALVRVSPWVSLPSGPHAHCVMSGIPACVVCGRLLVGGVIVISVERGEGADRARLDSPVCSSPVCGREVLESSRRVGPPGCEVVAWPNDAAAPEEAMRRDYEAGCSVREVASRYHMTYSTAHKVLGDAGTRFRAPGSRRRSSE